MSSQKNKIKKRKVKAIIGHRANQALASLVYFTRLLQFGVPLPSTPHCERERTPENPCLRLGFRCSPPRSDSPGQDGCQFTAVRVDSRSRRADLPAHAVQATLRATGSIPFPSFLTICFLPQQTRHQLPLDLSSY